MKFILNVPYVQKEQAKAQGAHWDYAARTWYFEGETLPAGLSVWYDEPQSGGMSKRILPSSPASDPNDPYAAYLTVSALNQQIAGEYSKNSVFQRILVKGEVTNLSVRKNYYFSIKDEFAELPCILWDSTARSALKFSLQNGQQVAILGTLQYYEQRGTSGLIVRAVENIGEGLAKLQKLKLRAKLQEEGLFDPAHKKPIPRHAKSIGIVTSAQGQAFRDICKIAKKRCPSIQLVLYPVNVQGEHAVKTTVRGIETLDHYGVDLIIVGRGGGSDEELSVYDDEKIVRAIYAAVTPVISAVGHAGNHSFADDAADLFAATPSEAAEAATAETAAVIAQAEAFSRELQGHMRRILTERKSRTLHASETLQMHLRRAFTERRHRIEMEESVLRRRNPIALLQRKKELLSALSERMIRLMDQAFSRRKQHYELALASLHALSPSARLVNGFGYVTKSGRPLVRVTDTAVGDELQIRMHDGEIRAEVTGIRPEEEKE